MAELNEDLAKQINQDYEEMKAVREQREPHWEEKAKYIQPDREFVRTSQRGQQDDKRGEVLSEEVHSMVPIEANDTFSKGYQGNMTSKHFPWFKFDFENQNLADVSGGKEWLQQAAGTVYFELSRSNFYSEMGKLFSDAGWCGTATMSIEWDESRQQLMFHVWHPMTTWLEVDEHQRVNRVIRSFMLSAVNAVERYFPDEKDRLSEPVLKAYDSENPYETFEFWHSVAPREERSEFRDGNTDFEYESVYMQPGQRDILRESGFKTLPYVVWRPIVRSEEVYGRGPGDISWPAIRMINGLEKNLLTASQKMIDPAMLVDARLKGSFTTHPGANIYFGRDPRMLTKQIQEDIRYDVGIDRQDRAEEEIKRAFNVNIFAALANSKIEDMKDVRAMAFNDLRNERAVLLGPIIGNLEDETLDPIFDRVFSLLEENNLLPPVPEQLARVAAGSPLRVEYNGPLAQLQKQHFEQKAIRATLEEVIPILQVHPEGKDVLHWDNMIKRIAQSHNIPESLVREEQEMVGIREDRLKQQQEAMKIEQAKTLSEAQRNMAQAGTEEEGAQQATAAN